MSAGTRAVIPGNGSSGSAAGQRRGGAAHTLNDPLCPLMNYDFISQNIFLGDSRFRDHLYHLNV